jgi:hypothetical protein
LEVQKEFDGLVWNDEFFHMEKEKVKLLDLFDRFKAALI